ncbi:YHS domain-containing (seleno)protein [Parasedimentitalea psychrophila]|uniref:YHS domain-containing (Seleno)protein n=1 Tax=Parasedimentitalea psychrophila TaxID=2997337 RepID=A0A9Y2L067_9RHOB|nr:YHS domain-containing (seleno)protein [Parasedimentitalea psychrophila]WIY25555.1 YHS domain-containing (seleno)protein [Parasedimentitalea psychrophila]
MEFILLLRIAIIAVVALFFQPVRPALADQPMFYAESGLAISGYDTVAFFVERRAVLGHSDHAVMWKGAVWRFVSADNRRHFESNPRAYAPMFGGYCAYAVSQGYLMSGAPQSWQIVDNQLYLLYSASVQEIWRRDMTDLIVSGRSNWPDVLGHE